MATGGFMANTNIISDAIPTQSAQFAAFYIASNKISLLDLESEYWLEGTKYALPDDQVFYYKCHLLGLDIYMHEKYLVTHLDYGSSNPNRIFDSIYANGRNFLIFWHRFLFKRASFLKKGWLLICIIYRMMMLMSYYTIRGFFTFNSKLFSNYYKGIRDGVRYILSNEYKTLPTVLNTRIDKI